jgi:FkbM family methyltransferase
MTCDARDFIQATITHFGIWEPELTEFFSERVKPGDLAIDLGANVGYFSLLFDRLGADAIAVEAHPNLASKIRHNAKLSGAKVQVENVAVGVAGEVILYEAPIGNLGMTTTERPERFQRAFAVQSVSLMSLIKEPARLTAIKCDIEGGEVPVMRDILDNLERFNPRLAIAVEANGTDEWQELLREFLKAGFSARIANGDVTPMWDLLIRGEQRQFEAVERLPAGRWDLLLERAGVAH